MQGGWTATYRERFAGGFSARFRSLSKSLRFGTGMTMGLPSLGRVFCVRSCFLGAMHGEVSAWTSIR
jgi:hypothetical protein